MASTQAAVKAALKTLILARTLIATDKVQVEYGQPGDIGRRETIWLGATQNGPMEPTAFRNGRREEDYTVFIHIETTLKSKPEETEARAIQLAAEVEQVSIDNPTLGGAIPSGGWCRPAGIEMETSVNAENQPSTIATVSLQVKARLL